MRKLVNKDIVHPKLSYKVVGMLFDVYNDVGYGHREKHYEKAVAKALTDAGLSYKQQLHVPIEYKGSKIGDYFIDFLIEDKMVLELKQGSRLTKKHIDQVYSYLKSTGLELGLAALFAASGLKFKRVVNIK